MRFVLSIFNITQTQTVKPEETFISSAPIPLKQPFKKAFLRRKGLACLSGGKADTSSSPPHKRLFEREVWRSQTCAVGSSFFAYFL
ncbi:MAG: hypothetical protein Q4G42_09795 [Neisseria sp.]|nr:hypothetical protein [Neisseria sp.]